MEKQYAPSMKEKKTATKVNNEKIKPAKAVKEEKMEEKKIEVKNEEKTMEEKTTEVKEEMKTEKKKEIKKEKIAKEFAIVNGAALRISSKSCYGICKMIKGKTPEKAIEMLDLVIKGKLAVRMPQRELPHQKGKGVAGGRFPVNAAMGMKDMVKQLRANADVNGVENPVIFIAKADKGSRPHKREGRRAKRTNVYLEARDRTKLKRDGKRLIPATK